MPTYKDKTFCPYGTICKDGSTCDRVLTPADVEEAMKLGLPISQFAQFPECFKAFFMKDAHDYR